MPTMVCAVESSAIVLPMILGSALKRLRHMKSLIMTTGLPSGRPSSAVNARPI